MARLIAERADVIPILGEVFRVHGFDGASLAIISQATGLGKGSLYHFFPGGKEEMAAAVLAEIDAWFESQVFAPLRQETDANRAMVSMLASVNAYFRSGKRVCLVGVFALDDTRDRFADRVQGYFAAWTDALDSALRRAGRNPSEAHHLAEEAVGAIQGALVLARAMNQPAVFTRTLTRLEARLCRI